MLQKWTIFASNESYSIFVLSSGTTPPVFLHLPASRIFPASLQVYRRHVELAIIIFFIILVLVLAQKCHLLDLHALGLSYLALVQTNLRTKLTSLFASKIRPGSNSARSSVSKPSNVANSCRSLQNFHHLYSKLCLEAYSWNWSRTDSRMKALRSRPWETRPDILLKLIGAGRCIANPAAG